jgi:hypothetical protein
MANPKAWMATYAKPDVQALVNRYDGRWTRVPTEAWIKFGRELEAWRRARKRIPVEVRIEGEAAVVYPRSWFRRSQPAGPRVILTFGRPKRIMGKKLEALAEQVLKDNPRADSGEKYRLVAEAINRHTNPRQLRRNEKTAQLQRDREARGRALTGAEKQKRWRERHVEERRIAARVATMLTRRSHTTRPTRVLQTGWNCWVTIDEYHLQLATLLCAALKTDEAIDQLRTALGAKLRARKRERQQRNRATREIAKREAAE